MTALLSTPLTALINNADALKFSKQPLSELFAYNARFIFAACGDDQTKKATAVDILAQELERLDLYEEKGCDNHISVLRAIANREFSDEEIRKIVEGTVRATEFIEGGRLKKPPLLCQIAYEAYQDVFNDYAI